MAVLPAGTDAAAAQELHKGIWARVRLDCKGEIHLSLHPPHLSEEGSTT